MTLVDKAALTAALGERDAARAERDRAQEHLAYHLRDYRLNSEHTGDLAVDMASWAGRLQLERDAARAEVARLRAAVEGVLRSAPDADGDGPYVVYLSDLRAVLDDAPNVPPSDLSGALSDACRWLIALADDGPDLTINAHRKAAHEAAELAADPTPEEWADVAICLVGAAIGQGWDVGELADAVRAKVLVNSRRTWQQQDDGTWQHAALAATEDQP